MTSAMKMPKKESREATVRALCSKVSLLRFTQKVMTGPSTLHPKLREHARLLPSPGDELIPCGLWDFEVLG